jgi:branched-chain amino acid transport system permease protein
VAIVLISIAILIGLHTFLQRLKVGQAMRAVAQDSEAALLGGIRINHISGLALALGSGLAGLAGALLGPVFYVDPWIGGPVILKAFVIIIVGGMGSIPGAILAAFIFGFIESFGGFYFGPAIVTTIFFGALILILLVRPKGLLGYEETLEDEKIFRVLSPCYPTAFYWSNYSGSIYTTYTNNFVA